MLVKTLRNIVLIVSIICSLTFAALAEEKTKEKDEIDVTKIPGNEVLASLGETKLTMQQVRWLTPTDDLKTLKRITKAWLETELLYLEATKEKLPDNPETRFRAQMRVKQSYAAELIKKEQEKTKLTVEEMREHYDNYKYTDPMISTPAFYGFSHIRCLSKEKAHDAFERVKTGDDFNKIAAQESVYSEDKIRGGRVKKMMARTVKSRFGEAFYQELEKTKDGEIFGPVLGKNNLWEVGWRESMTPPTAMSFERVLKEVKPRIERADKMGAMITLKHNLKEKYKDITYRSPLIQFDEEKENAKKDAEAPSLPLDE